MRRREFKKKKLVKNPRNKWFDIYVWPRDDGRWAAVEILENKIKSYDFDWPYFFFGPRSDHRLTQCRQEAILQLHLSGYSMTKIEALTNISITAIYKVVYPIMERLRDEAEMKRIANEER